MTEMIIEAVVVALCVGGALGAVVTMRLQNGLKRVEVRDEDHRYNSRR